MIVSGPEDVNVSVVESFQMSSEFTEMESARSSTFPKASADVMSEALMLTGDVAEITPSVCVQPAPCAAPPEETMVMEEAVA